MSMFRKSIRGLVLLTTCLGASPVLAASFYGYDGSDYGTDDTNYQSQFASQANGSFSTRGGDVSKIHQDLQNAQTLGLTVVIDVSAIFLVGNSLNSNYLANWTALKNDIQNNGLSGQVAAFYPKDEPSSAISSATLQTIVSTIKGDFPSTPIAVIYAFDTNDNYNSIGLFDWLGVDCYSDGQWSCSGKPFYQVYAGLKRQLTPAQRMILVPQSSTHIDAGNCCAAAIAAEGQRMYQLSLADPKIVALLPFTWQTIAGTTYTGVKDVPALQPTFQAIGTAVKTSWTFPAGIIPVFENYSNTVQDHLYSTSGPEGIDNGYDFDAIAFSVYASQISGTIPLYRCRKATTGQHFISISSACEGYTLEATYGFAYSYQASNTTPLYRFYNSGNGDHLETTNYSEGVNAGLSYDAILGYVPVVAIP